MTTKMAISARKIDGIVFRATEEAWDIFNKGLFEGNGCGVSLLGLEGHVPDKYDELIEAFEKMRRWGTKPFGADFTIPCKLHDIEFSLRSKRFKDLKSPESYALLHTVNENFYRNLENVREKQEPGGWRKVLWRRWRWYRRSRDSALRRISRLYKLLVDKVGKCIWIS